MQKHVITVTINDLIKANARFDSADAERGLNAMSVTLPYPDGQTEGYTVVIIGERNSYAGTFVFTTTSESTMDSVTGDYNAVGVPYTLNQYEGRGMRVSVIEILKAGMMVRAPAKYNVLRVALPEGAFTSEIEMEFRNDGTSLYAIYDGIDIDGSSTRADSLAMLEACFTQHKVWFEAL